MNSKALNDRLTAIGADLNGINGRFMQDSEFYLGCLRQFVDDPSFVKLGQALDAGDAKEAYASAHNIKGSAGNLGLTVLYKTACEIVEALRSENMGLSGKYRELLNNLDECRTLFGED